MADRTEISWTDATWNPLIGCMVVSPGCTHCYAMRLAGTRFKHTPSRAGLTTDSKAGPVWNGRVRFMPERLTQPLHWRKPRDIFVCAHSDLFYETVAQSDRDQIFAIMWLAPHHRFQVLTKRDASMAQYFLAPETGERVFCIAQRLASEANIPQPCARAWPLRNVIVGISAETNDWFHKRVEAIKQIYRLGWSTWASLEPLLGLVDIGTAGHSLDWIVAGGESGPSARPMHPDWVRGVRDQCASQGIPFFFKQWGEWAPGECAEKSPVRTERTATFWNDEWLFETVTPRVSREAHCDEEPDLYRIGKKGAGAMLDGREWKEMPQ